MNKEANGRAPVERLDRRNIPYIGMWLHIQKRYDNGGFPLIRVEEIDENGHIIVTDWLNFDKQSITRTRKFAPSYDEFSRRVKYWKKVTPNAEITGGDSRPVD